MAMDCSCMRPRCLNPTPQAVNADSLQGRVGRLQTIDVLLRSITRRLGAVKAAMAAELTRQQQQQAVEEEHVSPAR